ncbi:MAG TPA: carbohydrate kinase [Jatrophihabitantaceae bacterium]|nr:carbohydrate kinase [Jatrophihabitantaceae bacterium]
MTARVLVIGEALVDMVRPPGGDAYASPGGSPANVAVGLGRLDVPTALLTRLGRDAAANIISTHLARDGVELLATVDDEPTSVADADVDLVGNAGYAFDVHWELSEAALGALDLAALRCVHTGSIAAVQSPGAEVVHRLVRQLHSGATISYDPNCRPSLMGAAETVRPSVGAMLTAADIVKASDEDLAFLYPGTPVFEAAERWAASGPALVVLTQGALGYRAWNGAGTVTGAAVPVDVEDTVGAGDAFMSALLAGLHDRDLLGAARRSELRMLSAEVLAEVLHEAAVAAAITCSRPGADPPSAAELAAAVTEKRPN